MIWWLGLHALLGLTAFMVNPLAALPAVPLLMLHGQLRRPAAAPMLIVSPGGVFALPAAGRFKLSLVDRTRYGAGWAELVFSDRPGTRLLLLRDQFDERDWRRLCLALTESR